MSANGQLPQSELAPIAGGGYLRKDAAAAWNAMAAKIRAEEGVTIAVNGPDSAYRTLERQVYWRNYWCSRGACQNAAVPGTSNHGWGIACDVPEWVRALIATYGKPFGWDRGCSDAPWETWHHKWCGGWSGKDPGPAGTSAPTFPTLKQGDRGDAVKRAQRHLRRWNVGITRPEVDGDFGKTTHQAVREFQFTHGLPADGVIGTRTWKALRRSDPLYGGERLRVNRLRLARWGEVKPHEDREVDIWRNWCAKRARAIQNAAQKDGWDKDHRRARFTILKNAAPEAFDNQPH